MEPPSASASMEAPKNLAGFRASDAMRAGPKPDWAAESPYDLSFAPGRSAAQLTYLLFDRQVHAELRATYVRTAVRLESLEAVQSQSQWRLDIEPQTQSCVLHSLKLLRDGQELDQLHCDQGRILPREEGVDRLVIDGWVTFLLVLEDVRVGDVLEWSYTLVETPRIMAGYCLSSFQLPAGTDIGQYQFRVRFAPTRALKWKSSMSWRPVERAENALRIWTWQGEKYASPKPDAHTPCWHALAPWIQLSDCPDWRTVSAALAQAWNQPATPDDAVLAEWLKAAEKAGPELADRLTKVLDTVQDDCRYLNLQLEIGGQIPTPPAIVARRRYGDSKDLGALLVSLLHRLGVKARPILVHTVRQKTIAEWLPSPALFNHVVVEFEVGGKRRWIDPTLKRQGGTAFSRVVTDFGFGLPVDAQAGGLVAFPPVPGQVHRYEVRETILVDTSGESSLVAWVVRAEGARAELLRNELAAKGLDDLANRWQQLCANRFGQAKRVGATQYRDDRRRNQLFTAEVYEISGFLRLLPDRRRCQLQLPNFWMRQTILPPENLARSTPLALPHPCQVTHILDLEFATLRPLDGQRAVRHFAAENPFFHFDRTIKSSWRFWTVSSAVETLVDAVPVDQMEEYGGQVATLWSESSWTHDLPVGYPRLKGGKDFGCLPEPAAPLHKVFAEDLPVDPAFRPPPPQPAAPLPAGCAGDLAGVDSPPDPAGRRDLFCGHPGGPETSGPAQRPQDPEVSEGRNETLALIPRRVDPALTPHSAVGYEIERTCRAPSAVGRVTPCAPRLPPAGAKFPWRRLPDPLAIKILLEFPVPTSELGFSSS